MVKYFHKRLIKCLLGGVFLVSCRSDRLHDVNLEGVQAQRLEFQNLEESVFGVPSEALAGKTEEMVKTFGEFYNTYLFAIVNRGEEKDSVFKALQLFVKDPDIRKVYDLTKKEYPEGKRKEIEEDINQAFRYFSYHFPAAEYPLHLESYVSGFNYACFTADSTLGLGLDMFLGDGCPYYKMLQLPKYLSRRMTKDYLVTDAMRAWIIHCFEKKESASNLLALMIHYGKLYYVLDAVLPDVEDSIKIGYSSQQMEYCIAYGKNLWAHFLEKDRLYKNDLKEVSPYISEGPFTSAIGKQCPPRIAMWVGWKIVRAYMEHNSKVSLAELMEEKDNLKILNHSKFRP